jgi:Septum formation
MAAPAGVSSGSTPEPPDPGPAATKPQPEPVALQPPDPDPAESAAGESTAAVSDPEQEPTAALDPEQEPADALDPEQEPADVLDPEQEPEAAEPSEPAGKARGVGWLITAAVVIVVVVAAAAAGVLVVVTHGFRPKTVVTYRAPAVYALRAGDCINSSQNGLSVTILSCATPHEAEVFATFRLTGSSWPGGAAVEQQANSGCADRIAGYLNPQLLNAGLIQEYVYPNRGAWQAGVRTVVCEVSSSTGPLTGSVRNGG